MCQGAVINSVKEEVLGQEPPATQEISSPSPSGQAEPSHTQSEVSRAVWVKGVKVARQGGQGVGSKGAQCHHLRGGYCVLHGEGAVKKFKPVVKTTAGPGGKLVKSYSRQVYYECEEGKSSQEGGLRQTQLSFAVLKTTPVTERSKEDTAGGFSAKNKFSNFSSTTLGQ